MHARRKAHRGWGARGLVRWGAALALVLLVLWQTGVGPRLLGKRKRSAHDGDDTSTSCPAGSEAHRARLRSNVSVLYFTRHEGTRWDFARVAGCLGLRWAAFNPEALHTRNYMDERIASRLWLRGVDRQCALHDVVVIADTVPDAWPLLQFCGKPLVVQATARVDVYAVRRDYHDLLERVARRQDVFWVQNSLFEWWHATSHGVHVPESRRATIRATGWNPLPARDVDEQTRRKFAVISKRGFDTYLTARQLRKLGIPFVTYTGAYGGPRTLAQHRAVVHMPYQVSTMAMYENVRAGVVYIVPSVRLLEQYRRTQHWWRNPASWWDMGSGLDASAWAEWTEWYGKDFGSLFLQFDSWHELQSLVSNPLLDDMLRERRERSVRMMADMEGETMRQWVNAFEFLLGGSDGLHPNFPTGGG